MKRYISYSAILALVLTSALVFFNQCSMGDTTRVTIQLKPNQQALKHNENQWLSKIFYIFYKKAYAFTVWDSVRNEVLVVIEGSDMTTIEVSIPPLQTSYTIEVPSGSQRIFSVYGINTDNSQGKNWGGKVITDLPPGADTTINIYMIPLPTEITPSLAAGIRLTWYAPSGIQGYYIYRATNLNGPYIKIATITTPATEQFDDLDPELVMDSTYYYKISCYNANGESAPSDPVIQLYNP